MKLIVTGATGFVGGALLVRASLNPAMQLRALTRKQVHNPSTNSTNVEWIRSGDLSFDTDYSDALRAVDVIVHTAARVHVMDDSSADPLAEFRRVNVDGTLNLARQAARAGIKRFIFLSSIKVNGEQTTAGKPFTAEDVPAPTDPYGISKHEAEQGLRHLAKDTGMEIVIIRPVLVYGPGVKANFLAMMRCLHKGIPLPLGAINNQRSFVALNNLVDLILTCVRHPAAANQVFLASDGVDLSTTELLRHMAAALGKKARLIPVPGLILRGAASLLGKKDFADRICGSLRIDMQKTRDVLGWTPPVSIDVALKRTAEHFLKNL